MKNFFKTPIFLILLLALLIRLPHLNQSFWLDETIQALVSQKGWHAYWPAFFKTDFNPPLFYALTIGLTKFLPLTEITLRLPSLILGTASVYLLFLISGKKTLPALLLATGPLSIYYSQEARAYTTASFLILLAFFLFQKLNLQNLQKEKKKIIIPLFTLSLLAAFFTHYLTLLTLPLFLFLFFKNTKLKKLLLPTFLPIFLSLLLYLPLISLQLKSSQTAAQIYPHWISLIGGLSLKNIALLIVKFPLGRISLTPRWFYALSALFSSLLFWGLTLWGSIKSRNNSNYNLKLSNNASNNTPAAFLLFAPIMLALLISLKIPVFDYFRLLFVLPFFYLLTATGVQNLPLSLTKKKLIATLLVTLNLTFSLIYLLNPTFHRENWKELSKFVNQLPSNTPVYINEKLRSPTEWYLPQKVKPTTDLLSNPPLTDTIYIVSYGLEIFDPQDQIRSTLKTNDYQLTQGDSFNKVGIEKWEKKN